MARRVRTVYQVSGREHIPLTRLNSQTLLRLGPEADEGEVLRHIPHSGRFKIVARASGRIVTQAVHQFEFHLPPPAPHADWAAIDALRLEQIAGLEGQVLALEARARRADVDREEARQRADELAVRGATLQVDVHHLAQQLAEARAKLAESRKNAPRSDDDDVSVLSMLGNLNGGLDVVSRLSDHFGNFGKKKKKKKKRREAQ